MSQPLKHSLQNDLAKVSGREMHCGNQGLALFHKRGEAPLTTGNDLNHMAFDITAGTYAALKAELEKSGVEVSGRPGDPHCIYFHDPDGHRLQLMVHE